MSRGSFYRGAGYLSCAFALALPFGIGLPICVQAEDDRRDLVLLDLTLEELSQLSVTSVSRRPTPLAAAAASIYVITGEEIRRSGSTTLAEALRLAPNLHVARANGQSYAISARGFNNRISNKLLVLVDGRTIYSNLFSGVYWDSQDLILEDIERIEVISGPGSTLWGVNAVNGVINVITRSADDTQGTLLSTGSSTEERQLAARYGGSVGEAVHYRVYAKHRIQDDVKTAAGFASQSGFHRSLIGFRTDWDLLKQFVTVQGEAMSGRLQQPRFDDLDALNVNLLARVKHRAGHNSELMVQTYLEHHRRDQPGFTSEQTDTIDLDLVHSFRMGRRHQLVWGGGYRHAQDEVEQLDNGPYFYVPSARALNWANLFAQNDIDLFDSVHLTLGAKFERNPYTGWESLPNVRLSWAPEPNRSLLWGSLARSVRSPSRLERDMHVSESAAVLPHRGGPEFLSEIAEVAELGYRSQPSTALSYSITLFTGHYERLRTLEPIGEATEFRNLATADSYGIEFWGNWQVADQWRLSAGVVGQKVDVELAQSSRDSLEESGLTYGDPEVYWQLRSSHTLTDTLEVDAFFRRVGKLGADRFGAEVVSTPAYSSLDIRCGWRLTSELEVSVVGQNLLDHAHAEFGSAPGHAEFRRALYVKLLWEL